MEFASASQAAAVMTDTARYLAQVSYPDLPAETTGGVLAGLEQASAAQAAARARAGDAFTTAQAHLEWGYKSLTAWYKNITKVSGPAARANTSWARQLAAHPVIIGALADGDVISESWARQVMAWTGRLPEQYISQAGQVMTEAAANGIGLDGLARIAAELGALLAGPDTGTGTEPGPGVRLTPPLTAPGSCTGTCHRLAPPRLKPCWSRWPRR